jgi:hypothetical protein
VSDCAGALDRLAAGLDAQTCHDFRGIREVAMCAAWQGMRSRPQTWSGFGQALRDSWARIRTDCAAHGGTAPESGFLQPTAPAATPQVSAVYQVLRHGRPVGVLVQEADGTLTSCVLGDCRTWTGPAGGDLPGALSALSGGSLHARPL